MQTEDLGREMKVEGEAKDSERVENSSDCRIEDEIEKVTSIGALDIASEAKKIEGDESGKIVNLTSCCIEDEILKVSLIDEASNGSVLVDENSAKRSEAVSDGDESESLSSSSSSASSSCSSSSGSSSSSEDDSDDDEEEEEEEDEREKRVMEVEEGEIRDVNEEEMDDVDGEDDGGGGVKGPIMSKNELKFLPPVPPVDVTLQPYQQTQPVGVVLSILGAQVIVEGAEKHNPLNEGSILWITESRSPLGLIDEIFGPVKNPYYMVRYNSEDEVPAGIHEGTPISFVPEFANHVLNDNNLYKKGYDASGENDEEISEEVEFSDDEKEAEYKRMLKMTKRGTNDQGLGNRKKDKRKVKNRDGNWKNGQPSAPRTPAGVAPLPPDQNQHHVLPDAASLEHGNCSCSSGTAHVFPGRPGLVPPIPQLAPGAGFIPPSNGVWTNGMPYQQQQSMVFPNGFPTGSMPWLQQNHNQHPYQVPLPNGMPLQQQFDPSQRLLSNVGVPGGQPNFYAGPPYAPWTGLIGQNGLNQPTFGMGLQGQHHTHPSTSTGGQGLLSNGLHIGQSCAVQPPAVISGNMENPQQFNPGASFGRGRQPYHRGGGRGRGRRQTK